MRMTFAAAVVALLCLAAPALAHTQPKRHHAASHAKRHPRKPAPPTAGAWPAPSRTPERRDTCPNGDCRGLNSPNGMGGSGSDF